MYIATSFYIVKHNMFQKLLKIYRNASWS